MPYIDAGYGPLEKSRVNQLIEAEMAVLSKERGSTTLDEYYLGERLPPPDLDLTQMVQAEVTRLEKGLPSTSKVDMARWGDE